MFFRRLNKDKLTIFKYKCYSHCRFTVLLVKIFYKDYVTIKLLKQQDAALYHKPFREPNTQLKFFFFGIFDHKYLATRAKCRWKWLIRL